jgi:alanyl-tRNA synthetase
MSSAYPHLTGSLDLLIKVTNNEEDRFLETLDKGIDMLNDEISRLQDAEQETVPGDFIFKLYDTYGFPVDIVRDVALEQGMAVDEPGFNEAMEKQRTQSKKSWKTTGLETMTAGVKVLVDAGHKASFVGYTGHRAESIISGLINEAGDSITSAEQGENVSIFCPETPFYAEAGGQIGDEGEISGPNGSARVTNTITVADGLVLHECEVAEGSLSVNDRVELKVAEGRRQRIACNHTATHILHAAMKTVLGDHIKQSGSLVSEERLRFDFTHFSPITPDEMARIENLANEEVRANTSLNTQMLEREEAIQSGAVALFGEKYSDEVRVVSIGEFSKELCGGTHVMATGEIGLLKVVNETGIAAGVRRIEAITGPAAFKRFQEREGQIEKLADLLKIGADKLDIKIEKLLSSQKDLEKVVSKLTAKLSLSDLDSMISNAASIDNIKVLATKVTIDSPKTLREMGDKIRDKLGSGVVVLGGEYQGKATMLAMVTKDLTGKLKAGAIIKDVSALVGGSGGGRPDMAQAGGPHPDKLDEALAAVHEIVRNQL